MLQNYRYVTQHFYRLLLLFLIGVTFLTFPLSGAYAAALSSSWQKGASIYPDNGTEDFASGNFQQSVKNLRATGANYVALIIPLYQDSLSATTVHSGFNTPSDTSLISAINFIHSQGMQVMLKPHVDSNGSWRAYINPSNKAAWFVSYTSLMTHYASIGSAHGVEEISVGAELITLSTYTSDQANTGYWDALIATIRSQFNGKLTYSANWGGGSFEDEKDHIAFWDKLDYIGISAYFQLTQTADASVSQLEAGWNSSLGQIQSLHTNFGKPVLFTEVGYRSVSGANEQPWNYNNYSANPDQGEQANDYIALFDFWSNYSWMNGVMLWNWSENPSAGTGRDFSYVPQNKQAQSVLNTWFNGGTSGGNGGTSTPTPTTTPQNPAVSFQSTTITPNPILMGNAGALSTQVTNSGGTFNGLVDLEIYNSNNTKVYQQVFSNQTLASNAIGTFAIHWTPNATGMYKFEGGVFSNDWSKNYTWNGNLASFQVATASSTPTPTPSMTPSPTNTPTPTSSPTPTAPQNASVSIWWPATGTTLSGVQPFKAVLNAASLTSYQMYWQVDGGQLNLMNTNNDHKESDVNVAGWNWKGNGPYVINFVAKTNTGTFIAQQSAQINVSH